MPDVSYYSYSDNYIPTVTKLPIQSLFEVVLSGRETSLNTAIINWFFFSRKESRSDQLPVADRFRLYQNALHYITLELFRVAKSTNTAKPLPYRVCRTKSRKQLKKKCSGKEISPEAVSKNSQRWSWSDIGRQTVPEAASGNRKRTIANSGQPCRPTSDH